MIQSASYSKAQNLSHKLTFRQKLIDQLFNLAQGNAAMKSRLPADYNKWKVDFAQDRRNVRIIFHLLTLHIHIGKFHGFAKFLG